MVKNLHLRAAKSNRFLKRCAFFSSDNISFMTMRPLTRRSANGSGVT